MTTNTPMTDALVSDLTMRRGNHNLKPGNAGYEGLEAFQRRRWVEMKAHARKLELDRAALIVLANDVVAWYENSGTADPDQSSVGSAELWSKARATLAQVRS